MIIRCLNIAFKASYLLAVGAVVFALFYEPANPFRHNGGDVVTPAKVRAGEAVAVTRNFTALRQEDVVITRRMAMGDCSKSCIFRDLSTGSLALEAGEYKIIRAHTIPAEAEAGQWRLEFFSNWETPVGRKATAAWPVLEVEVFR